MFEFCIDASSPDTDDVREILSSWMIALFKCRRTGQALCIRDNSEEDELAPVFATSDLSFIAVKPKFAVAVKLITLCQ